MLTDHKQSEAGGCLKHNLVLLGSMPSMEPPPQVVTALGAVVASLV